MYSQGYQPPSRADEPFAGDPNRAPNAAKASRAGNGASRPNGTKKPPRKRSFRRRLVLFLLIVILLAGACGGLYVWKTQMDVRPYTSIFLDNVYVDGIDLAGMTWDQGTQAVQKQISDKLNSWYVRLVSPTGDYKDITAATLGIGSDPTQALEAAWAVGHETSATKRKDIFGLKKEIEAAKLTRYDFSSVDQSADTTAVDNILNTLAQNAYVAPQDAAFLSFDPDNLSQPFSFQNEVVGKQLDVDSLRTQILAMISSFQSGEVKVQPADIQPAVTVADLQKNYALRFRAVTPIDSHSTDARNDNIRLAFSKINGLVLDNGKTFSFNKVVGKRTQANGFLSAYEYSYGELTIGWGGGVCQASTTVYLAAVQAGMKITDHTSHTTPVTYTDLGKDATVSDMRGHEVDFAFKNTSGGKIYMTAHVLTDPTNKKRLMCEIRIYGQDMGKTSYQLVTEVVQKLDKPTEPEIIEDTKAKYVTYTDEQKTVIEASEGYVVDTYLLTLTDGAETSRVKIATSTYKNRAARIYVGVTPRVTP